MSTDEGALTMQAMSMSVVTVRFSARFSAKLSFCVFWNFQQIVMNFQESVRRLTQQGSRKVVRRAPERSTPDLSRPCELDAGFRGAGSRACLLCAHRFSADSVQFDRPALSRPKQDARARSDAEKEAKWQNEELKLANTQIHKYKVKSRASGDFFLKTHKCTKAVVGEIEGL